MLSPSAVCSRPWNGTHRVGRGTRRNRGQNAFVHGGWRVSLPSTKRLGHGLVVQHGRGVACASAWNVAAASASLMFLATVQPSHHNVVAGVPLSPTVKGPTPWCFHRPSVGTFVVHQNACAAAPHVHQGDVACFPFSGCRVAVVCQVVGVHVGGQRLHHFQRLNALGVVDR